MHTTLRTQDGRGIRTPNPGGARPLNGNFLRGYFTINGVISHLNLWLHPVQVVGLY